MDIKNFLGKEFFFHKGSYFMFEKRELFLKMKDYFVFS